MIQLTRVWGLFLPSILLKKFLTGITSESFVAVSISALMITFPAALSLARDLPVMEFFNLPIGHNHVIVLIFDLLVFLQSMGCLGVEYL